MSKIFISYEFKDVVTKPTVDNWRNQNLGNDISFLSIPYIPNETRLGKKKLRKKIHPKIREADIVMVLVSGSTLIKPWMLYEIRVGQCFRKKLFWCPVDKLNPELPPELKRVKRVKLEKKAVEDAIRELQSKIDIENLNK